MVNHEISTWITLILCNRFILHNMIPRVYLQLRKKDNRLMWRITNDRFRIYFRSRFLLIFSPIPWREYSLKKLFSNWTWELNRNTYPSSHTVSSVGLLWWLLFLKNRKNLLLYNRLQKSAKLKSAEIMKTIVIQD